jgi:hypothetical protein
MPQANFSQHSFNGGAISPLAEGRRDIPAYAASARRIENWIPIPTGPAMRRQGTRYVATVAGSSKLIEFQFSNEQSYILLLTDQKIQIFTPSGTGGYVIPKARSFGSGTGVINQTTETIRFQFAHYFADESGPYQLTTDNALPTGLSANQDYFVIHKSAAAIGLETSVGAADVNISGTGTGTHTLTPVRNDGLMVQAGFPSTVIQELASPFLEADIDDIDYAQQADLLYFAHPDYEPCVLERRDVSSFRLRQVDFQDGPYDPINSTQVTLNPSAATGTEAPIRNPHFTFHDVFINTDTPASTIILPEHGFSDAEGPFELDDRASGGTLPTITGIATGAAFFIIRTDKDSFQVATTAALALAGTVAAITATGDTTAYIHGRTADTAVFSSNLLDDNGDNEDSRDIRRLWRYREGLDGTSFDPLWSWGQTAGSAAFDSQTIDIIAGRPYTATGAERIWRLGAFWSSSTTFTDANYPARVFFHESRLFYANTRTDPVTFWGSQSGDFENFAPDEGVDDFTDIKRTVTDASGLTYTLASGQQNAIQWMSAGGNLLVATSGAIWSVQGAQVREALKPTSINAKPSNSAGAAAVRPVVVADEVVYLSRSGRKVMAVGFEFERDGYVPKDLSQIAGHLVLSPVKQFAYAIEPHGLIWAVRADGGLIGATYSREQDVLGWFEYTPGGNLDGVNAEVESIAVINDFDDKYDVLWMVVKRTIEGNTVRHLEFQVRDFDLDDAQEDAHFVDAAPAPYSGVSASTFTGFDHLDGEEIDVLADGVAYTGLTVISGQITLPNSGAATKLIGGLPYTSRLDTLPLEVRNAPGGTLIGRQKRMIDLYADVNRTGALQVGFFDGAGALRLNEIQFNLVTDLMGDPPALFTGLAQVGVDSGYELPLSMVFLVDKPVPCTLNSIVGRVDWNDRGGGTG